MLPAVRALFLGLLASSLLAAPSVWADESDSLTSDLLVTTPEAAPEAVIGGNFEEDPQTALMSVIEPALEIDATSTSPLDDSYDPASGQVTFSVTDISIPGNSDIPVELSRWVPTDDYDTGGPTGWAWNLPFVRGHYLDVKDGHSSSGWDWGTNNWRAGKNCSGDATSVVDNKGELIAANAYWKGKLLHIPGVTSETFLIDGSGQQVTKSNFKVVSCINNSSGQQGMVVSGPNGLTYIFNQINSYYNGKTALKNPIIRTRLLLVSRIQDRFGNYVDYTYTNGALTQISASDGRTISISYQTTSSGKERPITAVAHGKTWTYTYRGSDLLLSKVTLPDGASAWEYQGIYVTKFDPDDTGGYSQLVKPTQNYIPGCTAPATQYSASVKSPDGLTATYTFKKIIHRRSDVNIAMGLASLGANLASGNVADAAVDAVGIVMDTAAAILPGVPAGAGATIKAVRTAENVADIAVGTAQGKNLERFVGKVPANAKGSITTKPLPNGGVVAQAISPGKVPGSLAIYEKQIDAAGNTVQYTKTTYGPNEVIIHVKDKMTNETFLP